MEGVHVLCSDELTKLDHRLVWWMLAHQEHVLGVASGTVPKGWRVQAARELEVSDVAIWKSQERLKRAGIIECPKFARAVRIRGEAFTL